MALKEKAMINQADRRLRMENKESQQQLVGTNQVGEGPWAAPGGPGVRPMGFMAPPMGPPLPPNPFVAGAMFMPPQLPHQPNPMGGPDLRRDLPLANEEDLELLRHDPAKTINIDNQPRDIRYYEETATCVMAEDDVRELSFERPMRDGGASAATRRVLIDGEDGIVPPLELDSPEYTDFVLDGVVHKIRLGAPTRELWLDGQWYECYFDKEIRVRLGQSFRTLQLEGPPPSVRIGERRPDLCAGFVRLIHNGKLHDWRRLYLDTKPQLFEIGGKPHVLRFAERLHTLLINGHPFRASFGGLPMVIYVNGIRHYLRLSALPPGVRAAEALVPRKDRITEDGEEHQTPLPGPSEGARQDSSNGDPGTVTNATDDDDRFDSEGHSSAFDRLLKLFPNQSEEKRDVDTASESDYNVGGGGVEGQDRAASEQGEPAAGSDEGSGGGQPKQSPSVNVHDLWTQLLGAGLVGGGGELDSTNVKRPAGGGGGIPGLEVPTTPQSTEDRRPPIAVKTEAAQEEDQKDQKKDQKKVSPAAVIASGPDFDVKDILLKSHDSTLKE